VVKSLVLGKRDSTYKLFIENLKPRWWNFRFGACTNHNSNAPKWFDKLKS
jgi:hypothetical protein